MKTCVSPAWAPIVQQQELVEFVQLFQDVLYMIVISKNKTVQLGPLLLAGSIIMEEESPCMP